MDWRERAAAMSEARAAIHDSFRIPVMFSPDNGGTWRVVFCRLHESVNPDGQALGNRAAMLTVDTDSPVAIFRHSDVPDLKQGDVLSFSEGVAYKVKTAAPPDRYGYRNVRLNRDLSKLPYPVPDWEAL